MSQGWVKHQERGTVFSLKLIAGIALVLGRPIARALLYPICLYFILFSRGGVVASREYLARVLGRAPRFADVFRHHYVFATTLVDRVFLMTGRHNRVQIVEHGSEQLQEILSSGRGCILLGAHLGSFELVRLLADKAQGPVVNMMMYEENARKVSQVVESLGGRAETKIIPIGSIDALLRAQACIERGEVVGMLGDRVLGGEKTVSAQFFGGPIALPAGPYLAARSLRVPVVLFFGLHREGSCYDVYFEVLAEEIDIDRKSPRADLERWAARYVARLEHYCRLAPYNWFNFFRYWEHGTAVEVVQQGRAT